MKVAVTGGCAFTQELIRRDLPEPGPFTLRDLRYCAVAE